MTPAGARIVAAAVRWVEAREKALPGGQPWEIYESAQRASLALIQAVKDSGLTVETLAQHGMDQETANRAAAKSLFDSTSSGAAKENS